MRRIGSVGVALAAVALAAGCSGKSPTKFDTGTTGTTGSGSTSGTSTTGSGSGSGSSTGTSGGVDAGSCGNLTGATINKTSPADPVVVAPSGTVTLDFVAQNAAGQSISACGVVASRDPSSTIPFALPSTLTTDASGTFSITFNAPAIVGTAVIDLDMSGVSLQVTINVALPPDAGNTTVDAGAPVPYDISLTGASPSTRILNVKGTGTDTGTMKFTVVDQYGKLLPGAIVDFTLDNTLLTLTNSTATTDNTGVATVGFSATNQPGSSNLTATVENANPVLTTTESITVHSGRPEWQHFQFYCDQRNIPVYSYTTNVETVNCTVKLGDRYGNNVDTPTTVTFASEAGTFTPDPTTTDSTGVATVQFQASPTPLDVAPLAANPNQYPIGLANDEPSNSLGTLVRNPRDQLVTIIASVKGEEENDGTKFIDLGDPYVDANDDNKYESGEKTICTTPYADGGCAPYSYGNGQWDENTTIWVERHLTFTQTPVLTNVDTFGSASPLPNCLGEGQTANIALYSYDNYENLPALTTTFNATTTTTGLTVTPSLNPLGDTNGSVVINDPTFGNFVVAASDGGLCDPSNGPACMPVFVVNDFSRGGVGYIAVKNNNALGGATGTFPDGGVPGCVPASVNLTAKAASNSTTSTLLNFTIQQ